MRIGILPASRRARPLDLVRPADVAGIDAPAATPLSIALSEAMR
jgi:hypothetical protein